MSKDWDPDGVGISNGNYFGFPYSNSESKLVLMSIPWDVTTSYGSGTALGPKAIVDASTQLDFFHERFPKAWENKIGTLPTDPWIRDTSNINRVKATSIIESLEKGEEPNKALQVEVNDACQQLLEKVEEQANHWINQGKLIGLVGGDHSVPLGLMKALDAQHDEWGILQIDAHKDLRQAYEGFTYSHASIMYNALQETSVNKIVQVGVRDWCQSEADLAEESDRLKVFSDKRIKTSLLSGQNWKNWCGDIVKCLPQKVYISFDIDGLSPELCPNTGTPVPGGLSFEMVQMLLDEIHDQQKTIIGFDLVEVTPGENNDWDANVGARILYELCQYTLNQHD